MAPKWDEWKLLSLLQELLYCQKCNLPLLPVVLAIPWAKCCSYCFDTTGAAGRLQYLCLTNTH